MPNENWCSRVTSTPRKSLDWPKKLFYASLFFNFKLNEHKFDILHSSSSSLTLTDQLPATAAHPSSSSFSFFIVTPANPSFAPTNSTPPPDCSLRRKFEKQIRLKKKSNFHLSRDRGFVNRGLMEKWFDYCNNGQWNNRFEKRSSFHLPSSEEGSSLHLPMVIQVIGKQRRRLWREK